MNKLSRTITKKIKKTTDKTDIYNKSCHKVKEILDIFKLERKGDINKVLPLIDIHYPGIHLRILQTAMLHKGTNDLDALLWKLLYRELRLSDLELNIHTCNQSEYEPKHNKGNHKFLETAVYKEILGKIF